MSISFRIHALNHVSYLQIFLFQFIVTTIAMSVEDRSWMYDGWNDNGRHSSDWVRNTNAFLDQAFNSVSNSEKLGVLSILGNCMLGKCSIVTMESKMEIVIYLLSFRSLGL